LRDSRINTIFEGSSEIMRLFIAREMLDPHLKVSAAVLNSQLPTSQRLRAAMKAAAFYAVWYPKQFFASQSKVQSPKSKLARHLRYAARMSRKLARAIFHAMLRHGPKLEREQLLLGRFVDIGTELFAITATCLRAQKSLGEGQGVDVLPLADFFCRSARCELKNIFAESRRTQITPVTSWRRKHSMEIIRCRTRNCFLNPTYFTFPTTPKNAPSNS